jgi:hydroxyacylglutathione hydrolase
VIIERSMHDEWLSNTYVVADELGGSAVIIDAGGPVEPLLRMIRRGGFNLTHVLLTHHHFDHVSEVGELRRRWPSLEVLMSSLEQQLWRGTGEQETGGAASKGFHPIEAGQSLVLGALEVCPLHTPGHTAGMLSFLVGESVKPVEDGGAESGRAGARPDSSTAPGGFTGRPAVVFTGDTLFKGSVGGVKAPGHTTYTDLRDSIMGTLMELAPDTVIYPGHAEPTTVGHEWGSNAFIRVWRGLDREGTEQCTALGRPATLVLLGRDYDGGTKAWIRWPDGSDDIVPGSRVERKA